MRISTGEYPPYTSKTDKTNSHLNQLIKEAFALEDIEVQFFYFPWARAYNEALTGGFDATSYWYLSEERAMDFHYSEAVVNSPTFFFHRKDKNADWQSLSDLKGKHIGVTRGYTYTQEFLSRGEQGEYTLHWANSDEQNFRMLLVGRTEMFPIEAYPAFYLLKKHFPEKKVQQLTFHKKPLTEATGHLLFPKKSKRSLKLLKHFNKGLETLKKTGRFDEIYSNIGPVSPQ